MPIVPNSRPRLTTQELKAYLKKLKINIDDFPLLIVGIRGYYLNTMGATGKNDRGIYDDAIYVVTQNTSTSFNGNTDPSTYKKGSGKGSGKGMAKLKTGLWRAHKFGKHKDKYEALIQTGGEVTVIRDGNPDYEDTGSFGINIHKGGPLSTSSLGCQTIHPNQWDAFYALVSSEAKRIFGADQFRKIVVPYLLVENDGTI